LHEEEDSPKFEGYEPEPEEGLSLCIPNFIPVADQFASSNILPPFGFYLI